MDMKIYMNMYVSFMNIYEGCLNVPYIFLAA